METWSPALHKPLKNKCINLEVSYGTALETKDQGSY